MKDKLFNQAINWVISKGFEDIRANTDDYDSPIPFLKPNGDNHIMPDITGKKYGNKSYIEIVTKDDSTQSLITKWKLLSAVASRKGGLLYLLASRGYKAFADNIVKTNHLQNVKVVSI